MRTQIGSFKGLNKHENPEQQPNNVATSNAETQADESVVEYSKWELPIGAKARLGKGGAHVIQFSPDGTLLAVGGSIGVWIYDAKTGKELTMFPGRCQSLAFSPDGRFLANGGGRFGNLWHIRWNGTPTVGSPDWSESVIH